MIQKEIIDLLSARTKIADRYLIEKDLILHRILLGLGLNPDFFENYAFKGGTCLMKCYLDYYRFSEDIDFTYINPNEFEKMSGKQRRTALSKKISLIMDVLKNISDNIGLEFKTTKNDNRYVEFGRSNNQVTFKLWYVPENSQQETFIKVQINFQEKLKYPTKIKTADNFFFGKCEYFQSEFLLLENSEWLLKIPKLKCYDIREIFIEKARAVLTRKGTKARDYIDIYMIEKKENLNIRDFKSEIIDKVTFALVSEKYKINLNNKRSSDFSFNRGEEQRILLVPLPKDFDAFFVELKIFLEELLKEFKGK